MTALISDETVLALVPALDADSYAVRDLAVEQTEHLLADDLRDELSLRLVGDHVLREQLRTLDGVLRKLAQQVVQTLARAARRWARPPRTRAPQRRSR